MSSISTFFARLISRELSHECDPWPHLLKGLSLSAEDIMCQTMMPLSEFNRLLSNALQASGDPGFGLRFGRHSQFLVNGDIGSAVFSAPTLLEVLRSLDDFSRLQAEYLTMEIKVEGRYLQLRGREDTSLSDTRLTQHEVMVLSLQNAVEMVLGRPFTDGRCHFAYPSPKYSDRYQKAFHSPCHFEAAATGIDIPRELLKIRSPFFDQLLWQRGRGRAATLMAELNDRSKCLHSHHILSLLRSQLPPLPDVKQIAALMLISERSLMRRLEGEGIRFRQLQRQVLMEWAHHYLADTGLSVDAIASQLGYQDTANFRRAFKRWNQCTPTDYRRQHSPAIDSPLKISPIEKTTLKI